MTHQIPEMTAAQEIRFINAIRLGDQTQCWEWQRMTGHGYGVISLNKKYYHAHRIAWTFFVGPIPDNLHVLHSCDNRPCCNPSHLFLGTNQDNIDDKIRKGRQAKGDTSGARKHPELLPRGIHHYSYTRPELISRGIKHWNAKLTEMQVADIWAVRNLCDWRSLAAKYGVSIRTIKGIVWKQVWRHITDRAERKARRLLP